MILRRLKDVESIDVGKAFGHPEGAMMIQWIISNDVGDQRYHHTYALRKYTRQPEPDLTLDQIPFHHHKYVQSPHILSGRMMFENGDGEKVEVGPGDTVYFYENEPHRGIALGDEPVELLCIIDCQDGGEDCIPDKPTNIEVK
jgi:mannose-6-phosphate isomerase-like protein (cupin superfamily)